MTDHLHAAKWKPLDGGGIGRNDSAMHICRVPRFGIVCMQQPFTGNQTASSACIVHAIAESPAIMRRDVPW